jgi:hypothetical protein
VNGWCSRLIKGFLIAVLGDYCLGGSRCLLSLLGDYLNDFSLVLDLPFDVSDWHIGLFMGCLLGRRLLVGH